METPAPRPAPAPAGLFIRGAATFIDLTVVLLLGLGVQTLVTDPLDPDKFTIAALLTTANIRILAETVWGASPGKWLTGSRVKFPGAPRLLRLPQSILRNSWLWAIPLSILLGDMVTTVWAAVAVVAFSIILGPDRRSVADLLAGAYVIDPNAPRRMADPVDHVSPRRAMAWGVDMALAALAGWALDNWLGWSWWALGLVVLAVLKIAAESLRVPTPGKALLGLRVEHRPGKLPVRAVARNLWILPALLLAAIFEHPLLLVECFIALSFLYLPDQRSATDRLAQATVTR